ncbi:helix-turn-helix domain-containing protein [Nocardia donostiensis]
MQPDAGSGTVRRNNRTTGFRHSRPLSRCPPMVSGLACIGRKLSRAEAQRNWNICDGVFRLEMPDFQHGPLRARSFRRGASQQGFQSLGRVRKMAGGPTLPKRAMGRELRRLRDRAGTSQAAAARAIEVSPQTIGRMEDGQATRITSLQVNGLCDLYRADDEERRVLLSLVQELRAAQQTGGSWWRSYSDGIPADFNHYLGLEEAATQITTWQETLLPGLLQTPEYRRAMIWAESPNLPTSDVERRIDLTERRQEKLRDNDFCMKVLLSEAVLRHGVGGPGVMKHQLQQLLELDELPNLTIRVVPFMARSLVGLVVRSFVLLEFPELTNTRLLEPPVVYVEGFAGSLYLERKAEIDQYQQAAAVIARVALGEQETRALVARVTKELES